jgi:hypothetical protein
MISNFGNVATKHQALQKTHKISVPLTTKYPEYKNTQTARSNAANGHGKNANANKSESDEKEVVEAQRVDRVEEAKWIIQVVSGILLKFNAAKQSSRQQKGTVTINWFCGCL